MIGHGVIGSDGGLQEFLNKPQTEQALTAMSVRKARAWEIKQLAKALGGKK